MKHQHFWTMCAAVGATLTVFGGATTALAHQQGQTTTIVGERAIGEEERSLRVVYDDLNLAALRGEQTLQRRVRGAARNVCAPNDDRMTNRPFSRCVSSAWNGALPQIDLAVQRAREIAFNGKSSIPIVAIGVVGAR